MSGALRIPGLRIERFGKTFWANFATDWGCVCTNWGMRSVLSFR